MGNQRRIITNNASLRDQYQDLAADDIVVGRVRLKPSEEYLLLDLVTRGLHLIPSALSQLTSRSKTMQARLLSPFMVPHTLAIHDIHELLEAINLYNKNAIGRVVSKQDRRNAGLGIHLWPSIEEIYTQASFGGLPFPFVIQPFYPNCRDVRVIILGDYLEAYQRHNPDNFRNNLHCGGKSSPCDLTKEQRELCRNVMKRGRFSYAYIDLIMTADNVPYLAEINLQGGMRGAKIQSSEYRTRVEAIHQEELRSILER